MSLRLRVLNAGCRIFGKRRLGKAEDPVALRNHFEQVGRFLGGSRSGLAEEVVAHPITRRLITPIPASEGIILHFHGGGYIAGSHRTHRGLGRALARASGVKVVLPDYALGPERPMPAAVKDARAVWDQIVAGGKRPEQIVLCGDSAGGGLALLLMAELAEENIQPAGCVLFSPWTDLSGSGLSMLENADADPLFPAARLPVLVGFAAAGMDPADPMISPLFATFQSVAPTLIQYSECEILRDDALRMADHLRKSGGSVELQSWTDTPHAWQVFGHLTPEGTEAIEKAATFIRSRLQLG